MQRRSVFVLHERVEHYIQKCSSSEHTLWLLVSENIWTQTGRDQEQGEQSAYHGQITHQCVDQVAMILDDEPLTNHAAHTFLQSKASVAAFP